MIHTSTAKMNISLLKCVSGKTCITTQIAFCEIVRVNCSSGMQTKFPNSKDLKVSNVSTKWVVLFVLKC